MQAQGWTFLKILLSRFGVELSDDAFSNLFLSDLSDDEKVGILDYKAPGPQIEAVINLPKQLLSEVHYSWFSEQILKIPYQFQPHVLMLFPEKERLKLGKISGLSPLTEPLSTPVRAFVLKLFFDSLGFEELPPKVFLPESDLQALVNCSKDELILLADLLGIYDLADEMRTTLDNKKIKAIQHCITPRQKRFLSYCLHQKEKIAPSPFNLSGWNGDREELQKKIHIRGLARIGKALSGQDPNLSWYIIHTLDTGRGYLLQRSIEPVAIPKITAALSQQVLQTLNQMKPKSKTT